MDFHASGIIAAESCIVGLPFWSIHNRSNLVLAPRITKFGHFNHKFGTIVTRDAPENAETRQNYRQQGDMSLRRLNSM
jgi:hypothetical protein